MTPAGAKRGLGCIDDLQHMIDTWPLDSTSDFVITMSATSETSLACRRDSLAQIHSLSPRSPLFAINFPFSFVTISTRSTTPVLNNGTDAAPCFEQHVPLVPDSLSVKSDVELSDE